MSEFISSDVHLDVNGSDVLAHLAKPVSGSGTGVLVLHAWWGLNDFFKQLCDRLAAEGFIALAPDYNSGHVASTIDEAHQLMDRLDSQRKGAVISNAIKYLKAAPGVRDQGLALIGFSAGAAWSSFFSSSASEDIRAAVLFYGGDCVDFVKARAAYLCHFAEFDKYESDEWLKAMIAAMQAAGRECESNVYPGSNHWFFENDRPEYDAPSAQLAWQRTLDFLRAHS